MNYEQVKELIDIFEKTDLNDMEVVLGGASVRLNRGTAAAFPQMPVMPTAPIVPQQMTGQSVETAAKTKDTVSVPTEAVADMAEEDGNCVTAPIVGTFYQSSAPDKPPYVKVGDEIAEGDVVCIIEAMKFMNEVTSQVSGKVTEILVKDGEFVEFGQPLFRVK